MTKSRGAFLHHKTGLWYVSFSVGEGTERHGSLTYESIYPSMVKGRGGRGPLSSE